MGNTQFAAFPGFGLLVAAGLALAPPALAAGMVTPQDKPTVSSPALRPSPEAVLAFGQVKVSLLIAINAVAQTSHGRVLSATFELRSGVPDYDVLAWGWQTETEYRVDARTGVLSIGLQPSATLASLDQQDAAKVLAILAAKTNLAQAVAAAEETVGGRAIDAGIEERNGVAAYEVQILKDGHAQAFSVDPSSGVAHKQG